MFGFTYAEAPEAAQKLACAMEGLSEHCWSAGWLDGTEYALWGFVVASSDKPVEWGLEEISPEQIAELRALSAECNGWVVWKNSLDPDAAKAFLDSGPTYVPMDEWLGHYKNYIQEQADFEREERERALLRCR